MIMPISSFLDEYASRKIIRAHMPGHKGVSCGDDITEIRGADSLYEADGIIKESEERTSELFGSYRTYYSCGGSTLCIQAMLMYLSRICGKRVLAARNCHRAFINAAALLDLEVDWLYPEYDNSFLSGVITADMVEKALNEKPADLVYITSPDYLGHITKLDEIAGVCHTHGTKLAVDNAHGAYLRFVLDNNIPMHPLYHGADICCDSAHKTLPVLTGGAYLHIAESLKEPYEYCIKQMMSVFGSSSPSYLILRSLDELAYCELDDLIEMYSDNKEDTDHIKHILSDGYTLVGDEPGKLTIYASDRGYTGNELAEELRSRGVECEYSDETHLVLMTTGLDIDDLIAIGGKLMNIPARTPLTYEKRIRIFHHIPKMPLRDAFFAPSESVPTEQAAGRICSVPVTVCPPGVALVVSGEVFTEKDTNMLKISGISKVNVVK